MPQLPWDLWLSPVDLPPSLLLDHSYDAATGRLLLTLTNTSDEPVRAESARLFAELDLPAADAWAWLQGRYMQTDALIRSFGTPQPEGYDGRYFQSAEGVHRYISREAGVLTAMPVITTGVKAATLFV